VVSRLACADSYSIFDKAAKPNGQRSLNFSGSYGGISSKASAWIPININA